MMHSDQEGQLENLLKKHASNTPMIQDALVEWNSLASGEFDARSGPRAAELFQSVANESHDGCVILALIFYELFTEFGEL